MKLQQPGGNVVAKVRRRWGARTVEAWLGVVTAWGGGVALLGERVARLNIGFCKILENFAKSSCAANSFK